MNRDTFSLHFWQKNGYTARRPIRRFTAVSLSIVLLLGMTLGGCGGGSKHDGGSTNGSVTSGQTRGKGTISFTVKWPEIQPANSRLIPEITKSIRLVIKQNGQPVTITSVSASETNDSAVPVPVATPASNTIILTRPTTTPVTNTVPNTTVKLELPAGIGYTVEVSAFPNADTTGIIVAEDSKANDMGTAITSFTINEGTGNADLVFDLQSTVNILTLTGTAIPAVIDANSTITGVTVTAKNAANATVLLTPNRVDWAITGGIGSNLSIIGTDTNPVNTANKGTTVNLTGLKSTYTNENPHPITVTATDSESTKTVTSTSFNIKPLLTRNSNPATPKNSGDPNPFTAKFDLQYANAFDDPGPTAKNILLELQTESGGNYTTSMPQPTFTIEKDSDLTDGGGNTVGKRYTVSFVAPNLVNPNGDNYRLRAYTYDMGKTIPGAVTADTTDFSVNKVTFSVVQPATDTTGDLLFPDDAATAPNNLTKTFQVTTANQGTNTVSYANWNVSTGPGSVTPTTGGTTVYTPPTTAGTVERPVTVSVTPSVNTMAASSVSAPTFKIKPLSDYVTGITTLKAAGGEKVSDKFTVNSLPPGYDVKWSKTSGNGSVADDGTYTVAASPATTTGVEATASSSTGIVATKTFSLVVTQSTISNTRVGGGSAITATGSGNTITIVTDGTPQFTFTSDNNTGYTKKWSTTGPGSIDSTTGVYTPKLSELTTTAQTVTITLTLGNEVIPITQTFTFNIKK